jgi:AcrR family transcriptional regulator
MISRPARENAGAAFVRRPLSGGSVEALAQRAGTTRQTFCANYSGLTELLEEYLSALLDEIEARHGALLPDSIRPSPLAAPDKLFRHSGIIETADMPCSTCTG